VTEPTVEEISRARPSRQAAVTFRLKVLVLQAQRGIRNLIGGPRRHKANDSPEDFVVRSGLEHRSNLRTSRDPAELALQLGKIQNLRVAAKKLDGVFVPAGETFGFWRQVGRATRHARFVDGRELREGCIVATVGGGLCQLSNALHDLALRSDFEVLERHAHTQAVPGSAWELGRDATVAWNHIDLRFRSPRAFRVRAELNHDELIVGFDFAEGPPVESTESKPAKPRKLLNLLDSPASRSRLGACETCGQRDCFRHDLPAAVRARNGVERTAYLLDAVTPEIRQYVADNASEEDEALTPIDRRISDTDRYGWSLPRQLPQRSASAAAIQRSLNARRKLSPPELRKLQMEDTDRIARRYTDMLRYDSAEVFVDLPLLKELHRSGALGGRGVTVWLSRFPLKLVHELLDRAALIYPDAPNLHDYRADESDVKDEWEALLGASRIVTPHAFLADRMRQFVDRSRVQRVAWQLPESPKLAARPGRYLYFPGPTTAREGAYAVREAARRLDLPVVASGRHLESAHFWQGVKLLPSDSYPRQDAMVVVHPAVMKNRPTAALSALSMGTPLIVTAECGLESSIQTVKFGDADALTEAIRGFLT